MKLIQVQNAKPGVMCTFLFFFFLEEVPYVWYIRSILDKNLSFTFFIGNFVWLLLYYLHLLHFGSTTIWLLGNGELLETL